MKQKGLILFIIIFVFVVVGIGVYYYLSNSSNSTNKNYQANKTSTSENQNQENSESKNKEEKRVSISESESQNKEEQISTFSTKIYSSDPARQNNVQITCNTLNGTIVENGAIFSFCDTVGQATTSKGYQKAEIFDNKGNKKPGLGGGNCQVSTTLYNSVLAIPTLAIVERHEHSKYVPYIEKGKDAAVAYGSYDLKFQNNSGTKIRIDASTDGASVTTSIIRINEN